MFEPQEAVLFTPGIEVGKKDMSKKTRVILSQRFGKKKVFYNSDCSVTVSCGFFVLPSKIPQVLFSFVP